jgi:hypothetical protein
VSGPDELAAVEAALAAEGVDPRDLGRLVTRPFPGAIEPESFDAEAAFPVLLAFLPRLGLSVAAGAREAPARVRLVTDRHKPVRPSERCGFAWADRELVLKQHNVPSLAAVRA